MSSTTVARLTRTLRVERLDGLVEHSYTHGGSVHASTASRYRQWMTHKLSTWVDQFDTSGCIAWRPAAIDITQEAVAIATAPRGGTC